MANDPIKITVVKKKKHIVWLCVKNYIYMYKKARRLIMSMNGFHVLNRAFVLTYFEWRHSSAMRSGFVQLVLPL